MFTNRFHDVDMSIRFYNVQYFVEELDNDDNIKCDGRKMDVKMYHFTGRINVNTDNY